MFCLLFYYPSIFVVQHYIIEVEISCGGRDTSYFKWRNVESMGCFTLLKTLLCIFFTLWFFVLHIFLIMWRQRGIMKITYELLNNQFYILHEFCMWKLVIKYYICAKILYILILYVQISTYISRIILCFYFHVQMIIYSQYKKAYLHFSNLTE